MSSSLFIAPGRIAGAYTDALNRAVARDVAPRIMSRDASVFTRKATLRDLISNRLGWTDSAATMMRRIGDIERFGEEVVADGLDTIVLCGMGGSSLAPEMFSRIWQGRDGISAFHVLDTTDPHAIKRIRRRIDLKKTLIIVASKSGGTIETRSQEAYFLEEMRLAGMSDIGRHFVAITDSGSELQRFARRNGYRKVWLNPADIGGRYSALSFFGLVPAWLAGVDIRALVTSAVEMQESLVERADESNPGLVLGTLMAIAARLGRNKLSFLADTSMAPFVPWIEQLVAESTGKDGVGVVPIDAEPSVSANEYGSDRLCVLLQGSSRRQPAQDAMATDLTKAKVPFVRITLDSIADLGGQMLLWELATAVAGWHMEINPFDEPNVTESKNNTKELLDQFRTTGELPMPLPVATYGKLTLLETSGIGRVASTETRSLRNLLAKAVGKRKPPRYVSILNYVTTDSRTEKALTTFRLKLRKKTGVATLRGYGPRFLHSIGQLYKGGPQTGVFIVIIRRKYARLAIPDRLFDFGQLITAQALGDVRALTSRQLPVLVLAVDGHPADGIDQLTRAL